jgi:translation initiation factor IF-2
MSTIELVDLNEIDKHLEQSKQQHQEDGLYNAEDIKVYVDMYRKSIVKHFGVDFASGRINPEDIVSSVNERYGKSFEITRLDKFDIFPVIHLKEVRTK